MDTQAGLRLCCTKDPMTGFLASRPKLCFTLCLIDFGGAQWLSGRVLDSRPRGPGFEPLRCHCVVSLSKNIDPSLVLVQPRRTRPFITERLLKGCKDSNQTKQNRFWYFIKGVHCEYIVSYRIINKFINKKSVNKLRDSANMKTQASSEDSGQPAQICRLDRALASRIHKLSQSVDISHTQTVTKR